MPILAAGQRRFLFEKNLLYLFSYDIALREDGRAEIQGGRRLYVTVDGGAVEPDRAAVDEPFVPSGVYHVLDDERIEENDAITGRVSWMRDALVVPDQTPTATLEGDIGIVTSDDAVLNARYKGSVSLGPLGASHFDALQLGQATRVKAFIAPRFETTYPKYKWLVEKQCAGFGLIEMSAGQVKRATFDIYAMR